MTTKPRARMTFDLNAKPATADATEPVTTVAKRTAAPSAPDTPAKRVDQPLPLDRQQVGARVTKATYRKLKAIAALRGEAVQTLVEQAIDDFLAKNTSELVTK